MAESTSPKRASLHPTVAAFCRTGAIDTALQEVGGPSGPLEEAMLALVGARRGQVNAEEALGAARAVSTSGHDADLYLLFLVTWMGVAGRVGRVAEMSALLTRAKSLVGPDTPAGLRSLLLNGEAMMASRVGNMIERERLSRKALDLVARDSAHYPYRFLMVARFLGNLGRGTEVESVFAELSEDVQRRHEAGIAVARLCNATLTGQVADAVRFLKQVPDGPAIEAFYKVLLGHYRALLRLMLRHWRTPLAAAARAELVGAAFMDVAGDELPDWELVSDCLARRDPRQALARARVMAAENIEAQLNEFGFDAYSLVRAELSAGNGEAGRRIIQARRRRGNCAYIDDFFLARAELLAGHEDQAGRHFAAALAACERYRAQPRLDFELHLSCELSAWQGLYLTRLAGESGKLSRAQAARAARAAPAKESGDRAAAQLLGTSAAMVKVREQIASFASSDVPVLITGETGTGKELAARAIHGEGPRSGEPFLAVNCGAISESLLESELFGHEKGAFSGAERGHKGFFEEAGEGTVFLDEIGEISPRLQVALLRVLEDGDVRPVGASTTRRTSCRILAATNADLEVKTAGGRFRKDLFYRLRRLEIRMPPLSERAGDILPLADHFLSLGRRDGRRPVMSAALREALLARAWPGNVRELRNAIERLRLLNSDKLTYDLADLEAGRPKKAHPRETAGAVNRSDASPREEPSVEEMLRSGSSALRRIDRLRKLFQEHGKMTRGEAARILGVSVMTATRDLKKLIAEGLIEKVEPNRAPRSHYFRLRTSRNSEFGARP